MSEPIPESVPTSQDPRSKRPTKRRALTPTSSQATSITALFTKPDREITIPASSSASKRALPPPPEIVANVQGSSAGAGSGEFHVYKASRRREYERLRLMDEEVAREKENEEFERKKEEAKAKEEKKSGKNKRRREKAKARKEGKGTEEKEAGESSEESRRVLKLAKKLEDGDTVELVHARRMDGTDLKASAVSEEIGVIIHDDD
ncbi:hypothetical protein MMC20_002631 [Loxospora ochrophaea]|nr:hypothetical protein [Loxospora ochrophaea]